MRTDRFLSRSALESEGSEKPLVPDYQWRAEE